MLAIPRQPQCQGRGVDRYYGSEPCAAHTCFSKGSRQEVSWLATTAELRQEFPATTCFWYLKSGREHCCLYPLFAAVQSSRAVQIMVLRRSTPCPKSRTCPPAATCFSKICQGMGRRGVRASVSDICSLRVLHSSCEEVNLAARRSSCHPASTHCASPFRTRWTMLLLWRFMTCSNWGMPSYDLPWAGTKARNVPHGA